MKKAVIIGAGLGGLAAACLLSAKGYRVTVLEKNSSAGGKIQQLTRNGYRFDTGPSLLTLPFILEKLFQQCGAQLSDHLKLIQPEPLCRYFYSDGTIFDSYADVEKSLQQISNIAPEDIEPYRQFLKYSEELYKRTSEAYLFNPLYDLSDLKRLNLFDFLKIDAFSTVSGKIDQRFQSGYMKQFFKRFATYAGSSPFRAPATLNVIPHTELNLGGFYVKDGFYKITEILLNLAKQNGAEIMLNRHVDKINMEGKKVTGVRLKTGEIIETDICVANSDATDTLLNLMPENAVSARKRKKQSSLEPSSSGLILLLGCNRKWEQLRHHNIFFSDDYRKEFDDIFERKQLPQHPTIYLSDTSATDPEDAPEQSSNLFVLVNAPYVDSPHPGTEHYTKYRKFLITELEQRGLAGLGESVEVSELITPHDFLQKYGSNRGSIYGTSSNSRLSAFMRPRNKLKGIDNLCLVGGSTHPGGGIPLVIQSAFNAVKLLERYET